MAVPDRRGDARGEFVGQQFPKFQPDRIERGIDRLGDRGEGEPALAQRPRGKAHDHANKRR